MMKTSAGWVAEESRPSSGADSKKDAEVGDIGESSTEGLGDPGMSSLEVA